MSEEDIRSLINSIIGDIQEILAPVTPNATPESLHTSLDSNNDQSILSDNEFDYNAILERQIVEWKESNMDNNNKTAHQMRVVNQVLNYFDSNWLNVMAANTSGFVYLLDNEIIDESIDIYTSSNIGDCIVWFIAHIAGNINSSNCDHDNYIRGYDYAKYCRYIQYLIEISALFNQTNVIKTLLSAVAIRHPEVIKKVGLYNYMPAFSLHAAINNAALNHNTNLVEWLSMITVESEKDISSDIVNISCLNKSLFSEMSTNDINYRDYIKSDGYYYAILSNDLQLLDIVSNCIYSNIKKRSLSSFIQIMEALNTEGGEIDINNMNVNSTPTGYSINFPLAYALAFKYANEDIKGYVLRDANYATMDDDEKILFNCNVYKNLISSINDIDAGIEYLETIPNITQEYSPAFVNTLATIDRKQRYDLFDQVRELFINVSLDLLMCISIILTNKRPVIEFLLNMQWAKNIKIPKIMRTIAEFAVDAYARELLLCADGDDIPGAREYANLFMRGFQMAKNNFKGEEMEESVAKILSVELISGKTCEEIVEFIESRNINIGKVHFISAVYFARADILDYLFKKDPSKVPMYLSLMVELGDNLPKEQLVKNKQMLQLLAYHGVPCIPRDADTDLHKAFIY